MNRRQGLILLVAALLVSGAAAPDVAVAETWNWVLETHGADAAWTSPTAVPAGWAEYDWSAEYTKIEAQIGGMLWIDVTSEFGDTKTSGMSYALPFDIYKEHVNEPGTLVCDMHHWVDAAGNGQFTISNLVFGSLLGNPITGFRGTGETTVTPEPATLSLLALGGLGALLRRRRR
jgi:hypothetical protein